MEEEEENDTMGTDSQMSRRRRNACAFWLLGLCNNFAYVVMLCAAKDIIEKGARPPSPCKESIISRDCHPMSTGSVLLADIIPALVAKTTAPLYIHRIPFGIRHLVVVVLQAASFILVGTSEDMFSALTGIVLASLGSGFGEISYLALTTHFDRNVVSAWSSGTGGAGIVGSLVYAFLTDQSLLGLSSKNAMLLMLVLPIIFSLTYWKMMHIPHTVHRVNLLDTSTYIISESTYSDTRPIIGVRGEEFDSLINDDESGHRSEGWKLRQTKLLSKYMIPLTVVYLAEYFINQGLLELLEFDCSHGLGMSAESQYRWYQVTYQMGVFISRSSVNMFIIPTRVFPLLAFLQAVNAVFFSFAALHYFLPHIGLAFIIIFYEGLLGGSAYVNTFRAVHKEVCAEKREFSMGVVSISDTVGIVLAGFSAIPAHNFICSQKLI